MKCCTAFCLIFLLTVFDAIAQPPNILLITIDNIGYGDLPSYHPDSPIKTPSLDRLASEGARLTQFYTASSTCTVSRACLLTGRIPQRHGLENQLPGVAGNYGIGLNHSEILIPEILKTAPNPYATACIGKWNIGFAKGSRPTDRGFDRFIGNASGNMDYYRHNYREKHDLYDGTEELHREGEYATDILAEAASDFIIEKSKGKGPWFCYLPFNAPHFPMIGNKRDGDPNDWQAPDWAFNEIGLSPDEKNQTKRFWAVTYALDKRIGDVLDTLDQVGARDNTFVFFMSDNGAFDLNRKGLDVGSNYPLRSGGITCWEGGIRVPAMARWPGKIKKGIVIDEPFWSPDLLVACAELADAELPAGLELDGKNPLPILTEDAPSPHETFYFKFRKHEAVRKGDWKIVRENPNKEWQLFDLASDKEEKKDLAQSKPERLAEVKDARNDWLDSIAVPSVLSQINLQNFTFLREKAADWEVRNQALILRTQPGRIWAGSGAENMLMTPALSSIPRMLSAHVELKNPTVKYEQAGLVCYISDDENLKFVVEHIDGEAWVVSGKEGERRRLLSKTKLPRMSAELAMEVHGDTVMCRYRESPESRWKFASSEVVKGGSNRRIGFFTQDGPEQGENHAVFSRIQHGLAHLVDTDFGIKKVATGCEFTEGPALARNGDLYFSDGPNDRILRMRANGATSVFLQPCGAANGLLFDRNNNLWMCQSSREGGRRAVARMSLSDPEPVIVTSRFEGNRYIAPNDLAFDKKGFLYFTDPYYSGEKSQPTAGVYRLNPGNHQDVELVVDDLLKPNGILVSEDSTHLYVSDRGTQILHQYKINPDGSLKHVRQLYDFSPDRGIDGMWMDELGNIYGAAGQGETTGLFVISPDGHLLLHQPMPEFSTNVVIGGKDGRNLYLTASTSVYQMRTRFRTATLPPQ